MRLAETTVPDSQHVLRRIVRISPLERLGAISDAASGANMCVRGNKMTAKASGECT